MIEWDDDIEYDRPKPDPYGPAMPYPYTPDNDVNPACGCHRRSQCLGCGACTSCDACYCYED